MGVWCRAPAGHAWGGNKPLCSGRNLDWASTVCWQSAVLANVAAGSGQSCGMLCRGLASHGMCPPGLSPGAAGLQGWFEPPASGKPWLQAQQLELFRGYPSGLVYLWRSTLQGSSISHLHPPLPCVPAQRWLSIGGSTEGGLGCLSCVLPEDLLVAVLSERLQVRGVGWGQMLHSCSGETGSEAVWRGGLYLLSEEPRAARRDPWGKLQMPQGGRTWGKIRACLGRCAGHNDGWCPLTSADSGHLLTG